MTVATVVLQTSKHFHFERIFKSGQIKPTLCQNHSGGFPWRLADFRRGFPGFCWVQMVSSCFSVGKKWIHLESCGLLSSLAGDVSNSETGWAVEVCSFYPLHARHSVGPEESYEDESEEDEVSNKGGDWIKNILGLEQPNMSNTYQQMNTNEGLHNWSNLRFISSQFSLLQQGKQCWDDSTVLGC